MTLQSSGPISMSDIQAEFGGDGALSSYYRGGANVANTPANAGIPTSGAIAMSDFYDASDVETLTVSIPPTRSDNNNTPDNAQTTITPTVGGGVEPYTYLWELQSSNSGLIFNSSVAGSTLTLTMDTDSPGTANETWRLKITDDVGTIAYSGNCVVTLTIDP